MVTGFWMIVQKLAFIGGVLILYSILAVASEKFWRGK